MENGLEQERSVARVGRRLDGKTCREEDKA